MTVTNGIILEPQYRVLAFCGGKSRNLLLHRIALELVKSNHKVLITSNRTQKLPLRGEVVIGKKVSILTDQLNKEFSRQSLLYTGKKLNNGGLQGFSLKELEFIQTGLREAYFLVDLGNGSDIFIYDTEQARKWSKSQLWNQLVYCMEITDVDRPLEASFLENLEKFKLDYPGAEYLNQDILLSYLTGKHKGIRFIFEQVWPTMLYFDGIDLTIRENRAITLSRELRAQGIKYISIGNLQSNEIQKIKFS